MSYTRTYTGSVYYSGTARATYSYPASQNGGTGSVSVPYSGSVPVSVTLHVDTNPFDRSVESCSNSVRMLNGAVVSMNAAQVASIHKSANDVSDHLITGFFNMINSELSQNMAALYAKFKAVFELITTQSSILEKTQITMQDDYARISDRYFQIFNNLDEELEKRVIALDKNVFELSKRVQSEQLHSETSKKVTQFLIGVNEDEIIQQQLIIANAKSKVTEAMNRMTENVVQESTYSRMINSIVSDVSCSEGVQKFIPVIYTESDNLFSETVDYNCYSNSISNKDSSKINDSVKNYFVTNVNSNMESAEFEKQRIEEAFTLIAEKEFQGLTDEKSLRVYETLKKLKEN